ncbi:MAG: M20/M25/M40 family metallo-hydrolase [Comamonadaceae bacterium]|nr:M20/M25/M40 family metallo-hydrolase [Comamonadaceae bacterium]
MLLYGHLDKQPEFNGWRNDLGPWTPKYENGLLYGRGGADDGYAVYAAITAIEALDAPGHRRARAASASSRAARKAARSDLPAYLDALEAAAGQRRPRGAAWTAAPATTTSSGSRPACAAWSAAC